MIYADVFCELMAQRDDAVPVDDLATLDGKPPEWCYWQGYIQACADVRDLSADELAEVEAEYQRRQQFARDTMP